MKTLKLSVFPTREIYSIIGLVVLCLISYNIIPAYIIPGIKELLTLDTESVSVSDLLLFFPTISGCVLIIGFILLVVNLKKPLKGWDEDGLISNLAQELKEGLIIGTAAGFVIGTFTGVTVLVCSGLSPRVTGIMIVTLMIFSLLGILLGLMAGIVGGLLCESE